MSLADYFAEREAASVKSKKLLKDLVPELKALNVAEMHVRYDGSGDDGNVDAPTFILTDGSITSQLLPDLTDAITNAAHDVLESAQGGWELNEGSFGEVVLYVADEKLTLEHNDGSEREI